ncbi:unnamed protein product [Sphagnum balticum]
MVNLKIRLSNKSGSSPGIVKNETANGSSVPIISSSGADLEGVPSSSVLPPHLVGEDLALAKGLGTVSTDSSSFVINLVGVKARRRPGDKVHICVRCNFPIAVYGRLDPCEHVYCLTCAKLDSTCFLCDERVVRIQKMDVLEGIFICGAPSCLRSFLARPDFEWHVADSHGPLLHPEPDQTFPFQSPVPSNPPLTPIPQAKVQSQQVVTRHPESPANLSQTRPSSTASPHILLPKKDEAAQRKPPKVLRQDSQGGQARPIPELHLPDQFPHHRGGDHQNKEEWGHEKELQDKDWDRQQHRHKEWEMQNQSEREREWEVHGPAPHPASRELQNSGDRHIVANQAPVMLPPPPPYPPPNYPPSFPLQQDGNMFPPHFEAPRFRPRMPMPPSGLPGAPEYQEIPPRPAHPGMPMGMPQEAERGPNLQDAFGQNGPRPYFHGDFSPMNMHMGVPPRFHQGALPPPPPGPPPKRPKFGQGGEPLLDYGWVGGNLSPNFGGPGAHGFPGWIPPSNT